jgi:hypothetical protein
MLKKTGVIAIVVSLFAISLLVLAPSLFHKRETTSPHTTIASKVEPEKNQTEDQTRPNPFAPVSTNQLHEPGSKTVPRPVAKNDHPATNLPVPEPVKTLPEDRNTPVFKKQIQPKMKTDPPVISQNNRPNALKNPVISKQNQKTGPDSQAATVAPEQPSAWGVMVLATSSGVDGGISYRVVQMPLLHGLDLDLAAGIKQAGLGLSKYVYRNLGLGITGTVTYGAGEKVLGIYGKYAF